MSPVTAHDRQASVEPSVQVRGPAVFEILCPHRVTISHAKGE